MNVAFEIILTAILVSSSCAILGSFLVLKNMAMVSDAITHTVLLGIVLTFFMVHDLSSPFLVIGAGLTGVITVYFIELLHSTRLMKEDSAIGVIFPFLFSIAVILISKYAGNVHLDVDAVLLGELAFTPLNRMYFLGNSLPVNLVLTGIVFIVNLVFVITFFKELKISTFDRALAKTLGMKPMLIHYMLISLVSITSVASFEAVGSILVIAFMIGPVIISYMLVKTLKKMIILSMLFGIISSIIGYNIAMWLDISIAGTISIVIGVLFLIVLIFKILNNIVTMKRVLK